MGEETTKALDLYIKVHNAYKFNELAGKPETSNETIAKQNWQQYIYGVDKWGHPVLYDKIGPMNTEILLKLTKTDIKSIKTQRYRTMCKLSNFKSYLSNKYNKLI